MSATYELTIPLQGRVAPDVLIAWLDDHDFQAYEEVEGGVRAYVLGVRYGHETRRALEAWLRRRGVDPTFVTERIIEARNWNAEWEASVKPVAAGPFVIRPTWAETPDALAGRREIVIDPKMAFGTGHHESTRLVLRLLPRFLREGARVLDAGTGTGVLAIAAMHLGAEHVLAFDVDEQAEENARENLHLNGLTEKQVALRQGSLEVVEDADGPFDAILANIQREVLVVMLPRFAELLAEGGHVALAGLLRQDRDRILDAAQEAGMAVAHDAAEGSWWSVVLRRV